jgi:hypothetical protein
MVNKVGGAVGDGTGASGVFPGDTSVCLMEGPDGTVAGTGGVDLQAVINKTARQQKIVKFDRCIKAGMSVWRNFCVYGPAGFTRYFVQNIPLNPENPLFIGVTQLG